MNAIEETADGSGSESSLWYRVRRRSALMARLINSGINLSALLPFMAAAFPLCAEAVGIVFYGESTSAQKISILISSCLTIGFASSMS